MPLEQAQLFFGRDTDVDLIEVNLANADDIDAGAAADRGARPAPARWSATGATRNNELLQRPAGRAQHHAADPDADRRHRGDEHHLRPGHAGEEQEPRHRHPAHHGASQARSCASSSCREPAIGGLGTVAGVVLGALFCIYIDPIQIGGRGRSPASRCSAPTPISCRASRPRSSGRRWRSSPSSRCSLSLPRHPAAGLAGLAPRSGGGAAL